MGSAYSYRYVGPADLAERARPGPDVITVTSAQILTRWLAGRPAGELAEPLVAVRLAEYLADVADPAWPVWLELAASAGVRVVMLPVSRDDGLEVLFRLQVTARSMLGALALGSGGLLVDHGWIRVLGGGSEFLPDLASVNGLGVPAEDAPPPLLTVAFDVLGGRFAVNGGGLPGQPGEVCYWAPDTLAWTGLGAGYSQFARALLGGGLVLHADLERQAGQLPAAAGSRSTPAGGTDT